MAATAALGTFAATVSQAEPPSVVSQLNQTPLRDGTGALMPRAIYAPSPIYPKERIAHQEQGNGVFKLSLRSNGTVSAVEVLRSTRVKELDEAAVRAMIQWRFTPPKEMPSSAVVPLSFRTGPTGRRW
jgi:TonB family protein